MLPVLRAALGQPVTSHLNDEVANFIWVGWPGTVHGCGDEGGCHIVAENHLRPGLQAPVELGDVIVLYENKGEHWVEDVPGPPAVTWHLSEALEEARDLRSPSIPLSPLLPN